jgi:polar amino acid transport system substrate-binding protein
VRSIVLGAALMFAAVALPTATRAEHPPASEIAPGQRLRVAFQIGSPIVAQRAADGGVDGIAVDLGKFIADRLGVTFIAVVYADQELYAQSFGKGEWDVAIGARSALAQASADMGPDFMLADAQYIAAPGRVFADARAVDSAGVRVGVSRGGGSDQILTRALTSAQVVRVAGGVPNAVEALRTDAADVWAANPVTLGAIAAALPGAKVVPGAWTTGRYAAALPKESTSAARSRLAEIVIEAKHSGVVERAIARAGFSGVRVAPIE